MQYEKQTNDQKPTRVERVNALATEYMDRTNNELTDQFKNLLAQSNELNEQWQAEGYGSFNSYLTDQGEMVSIARLVQPEEKEDAFYSYYWELPQDQTFRVSYKGVTNDVTVPKQVAGRSVVYRGSGRTDYMYDIDHVERVTQDNVTPEDIIADKKYKDYADLDIELSDEMQWMQENFGGTLFTSGYQQEILVSTKMRDGVVNLAGIVSRQKAIINEAHGEAIEIEDRAVSVGRSVKKRLFESAQKLAARQDAAYHHSINS